MTATLTPPVQAGYTVTPVTLLHDDGADIADMEAVDVVLLGAGLEQIDIGGGGLIRNGYIRVTGPNLIGAFQALKVLADRAIDALDEAHQLDRDAKRRPCGDGCMELIDPDEPDCGAPACRRDP